MHKKKVKVEGGITLQTDIKYHTTRTLAWSTQLLLHRIKRFFFVVILSV